MYSTTYRPYFIFSANAWSQFLWYKNPGGDDAMYSGPWELGLIISEDECDTALRMTQLNVDGNTYDVIYTTGYFSNTFNAYWTDDADGLWTDPSTVSTCSRQIPLYLPKCKS